MSLFKGLLVGLGTILFIGPVFFVILKNTLKSGKIAGLYISIGILISDLAYIVIYKYSFYETIKPYLDNNYIYWIFSISLFTIGVLNITKSTNPLNNTKIYKNNIFVLFSKGFLINFLNPFVLLFWLGIFKYNTSQYDNLDQNLFLVGMLLGILIVDLLKILFSHYLKTFLNQKHLAITYKIIGLLFIVFSFYILHLTI